MSEEAVHIKGLVSDRIYRSNDGSFSIYTIKTDHHKGNEIKIVGNFGPSDIRGRFVECRGVFEKDPVYGEQFRVSAWRPSIPTDEEMLLLFISSGLFPGIGRKLAEALVDKFGVDLPKILDTDPGRLISVNGIGRKKLAAIVDAWHNFRGTARIRGLLTTLGFGQSLIERILSAFPGLSEEEFKRDPYKVLLSIRGIGFKRADFAALKSGISPSDKRRISSAFIHILHNEELNGHTYTTLDDLVEKTAKLIGVSPALATKVLEAGVSGVYVLSISEGEKIVIRRNILDSEVSAAANILRITAFVKGKFKNLKNKITEAEKVLGIVLDAEQHRAVEAALDFPFVVITGGPGTGKTTIIRILAYILKESDVSFALCAPTGRAAKRMEELCHEESSTMHRLLEYNPSFSSFEKNHSNRLPHDFVIVDEVSMCDVELAGALFSAVKEGAHVVLIGDDAQLPSIGPGNVLSDIKSSGVAVVCELKKIHRQSERSLIVKNAHMIREGKMPILNIHRTSVKSDFIFEICREEDIKGRLSYYLLDYLPSHLGLDPKRDIQVLTPFHKGPLGTIFLNEFIKKILMPSSVSNLPFMQGDKVIQVRNNYDLEVFNGEIGIVMSSSESEVIVSFIDRTVTYSWKDARDLQHAFAISIHKAQGSEYPAAVVVLPQGSSRMLSRNLIYTAVTRAKRKVVILTVSLDLFKSAVANESYIERRTLMNYLLSDKGRNVLDQYFQS